MTESRVQQMLADIAQLQAENERLTAALKESPTKPLEETSIGKDREIARLRKLLKDIAEYCSGDDRTLGAIERLATIRNTVDRELRGGEQSAREEGK